MRNDERNPVTRHLDVPDSDDVVVLVLDDDSLSPLPNLTRLGSDGTVLWQAEFPDPEIGDAYLGVYWVGGRLRAQSFSGFSVEIDGDTGKIVSRQLTK